MKVGLVANSFCSPNTAGIAFRKAVYLAVCVNLSAKNMLVKTTRESTFEETDINKLSGR